VPIVLVIVALVVVALAVGAGIVFGGLPLLIVIPVLLLLPGPFVTAGLIKRQMQQRKIAEFRRQAQTRNVHFDARDDQTLA
jgi:hypothetical protein